MIKFAPQLKADSGTSVPFSYAYGSGKFGMTKAGLSRTELLRMYTSWVFTCISIRAEAQAKTKWKCYVERGDEKRFLDRTHPAQTILDRPCPFMSRWTFNFYTSCFLDLVGESFSYIARDRLGVPRELWPLPPDKMRTIQGDTAQDMVAGYRLDWSGRTQEFTADEILHLRQPNPSNFVTGFSPTEAARYIISINEQQKIWHDNFYRKDASPDSIIVSKEQYEPNAKREFLRQWREYFEGSSKQQRVGFLDNGLDYRQISISPRALEYTKSHQQVRDEIFGMYRVPPSKAGLDEKIQARATAETINYQFWADTIEPRTVMIEDQLTLDLMDVWFRQPRPENAIAVGHENQIPQDDERQATIDRTQIGSGTLTINEARKRDGRESLKGGDEALVPSNVVPLGSIAAKVPRNDEGKQALQLVVSALGELKEKIVKALDEHKPQPVTVVERQQPQPVMNFDVKVDARQPEESEFDYKVERDEQTGRMTSVVKKRRKL